MLNDYQFYRTIFGSVENRETRAIWTEWISKNVKIIDFSRVVDAFFNLNNFTSDQILLLFSFITEDPTSSSLKKVLYHLRDSSRDLNEFYKYENLFRRLCQILTSMVEKFPDAVRLQFIYSIYLRLQNINVDSTQFAILMQRAYEATFRQRTDSGVP